MILYNRRPQKKKCLGLKKCPFNMGLTDQNSESFRITRENIPIEVFLNENISD